MNNKLGTLGNYFLGAILVIVTPIILYGLEYDFTNLEKFGVFTLGLILITNIIIFIDQILGQERVNGGINKQLGEGIKGLFIIIFIYLLHKITLISRLLLTIIIYSISWFGYGKEGDPFNEMRNNFSIMNLITVPGSLTNPGAINKSNAFNRGYFLLIIIILLILFYISSNIKSIEVDTFFKEIVNWYSI